jgi:hypothetical protein
LAVVVGVGAVYLGDLYARPRSLAGSDRLRFELAATCVDGCGLDWPSLPRKGNGDWILAGNVELAAYWGQPADGAVIGPSHALDLGDPPHIPEGATAILVSADAFNDREDLRITGVYADPSGEWTVTVAKYADLGETIRWWTGGLDISSPRRVWWIAIVYAPAPTNLRIRLEDKTWGPNDGNVTWL